MTPTPHITQLQNQLRNKWKKKVSVDICTLCQLLKLTLKLNVVLSVRMG